MKNTKYCKVCRLYRNLEFVRERTGKCIACEKEHALTERKPFLCQSCQAIAGTGRKGSCGVCGTEDTDLVPQELAVCVGCMDDPSKRGKILLGLLTKIARNKEEYGKV
jgi:hypothetical protein